MRIHPTLSSRRGGFTLVEMLVTAGVSILLMVIVTGAFAQGLTMFGKLRAQAKLQDNIRQAMTTVKDDLSWNHFQMPSSTGYGDDTAFVRGQDLTKADSGAWSPPPAGFFRIMQLAEDANGNPFQFDGTDSFGFPFARSTLQSMHFTVQRPGSGPDQMLRTTDIVRQPPFVSPANYTDGTYPQQPLWFPFFPTFAKNGFVDPIDYRGQLAGGLGTPATFSTRWSEVAFYLAPNGDSANGTLLYNLYRAEKLLLPLPADGRPNSTFGGPATAVVMVAQNNTATPMPNPLFGGTSPYNPEMSRRFVLTGAANVAVNQGAAVPTPNFEVYSRPGDVTQPRNRFGMLPAHDNPDPAQNAAYANLAGICQLPSVFTPLGRYPKLDDPVPYGYGANATDANNDLLLTNVISFEIKALWGAGPNGPFPQASYKVPDGGGGSVTIPNADYPFDYLPLSTSNMLFSSFGARVFDTWSQAGPPTGSPPNTGPPYGAPDNSPGAVAAGTQGKPYWQQTYNAPNPIQTATRLPLRIRIRALQIRIRLWDPKSEQTRQVTFVQDV